MCSISVDAYATSNDSGMAETTSSRHRRHGVTHPVCQSRDGSEMIDGDVVRRKSVCTLCRCSTKLPDDKKMSSSTRHRRSRHLDRNANKIDMNAEECLEQIEMCNHSTGSTLESPFSRRLVTKNGDNNVRKSNISYRSRKFIADLYTTLVDMKWTTSILAFVCSLVSSWILFALVWWLIAIHERPPSSLLLPSASAADVDDTVGVTSVYVETDPVSCLSKVDSFLSALLFSIETQHTIGYGTRSVAFACPLTTIVLLVQSCAGILLSSLLAGVTYTKLARPLSRNQTVVFSDRAVVCRRDGVHCLLFRVANMRRSHIVNVSARALLVRWRRSSSGRSLYHHPLALESETGDRRLLLVWPATVVHRITSDSPLWDVSADQLAADHDRFEIIVVLQGIIEITGKAIELRTSYLASEIEWGYQLQPLTTHEPNDDSNGSYEIDFSQFNNINKVPMTIESAHSCFRRRRQRSRKCDGGPTAFDGDQQEWQTDDDEDIGFDGGEDHFSSTFAPVSPSPATVDGRPSTSGSAFRYPATRMPEQLSGADE